MLSVAKESHLKLVSFNGLISKIQLIDFFFFDTKLKKKMKKNQKINPKFCIQIEILLL